ncbi:MAG: hypothetical protein Athens041674_642 [Parcubacteria group bacterium Athens0416_74]|nr:MAG: hypothetical protein Athens041674_642 [Parcubacteria group bacterium Athens0416_74]
MGGGHSKCRLTHPILDGIIERVADTIRKPPTTHEGKMRHGLIAAMVAIVMAGFAPASAQDVKFVGHVHVSAAKDIDLHDLFYLRGIDTDDKLAEMIPESTIVSAPSTRLAVYVVTSNEVSHKVIESQVLGPRTAYVPLVAVGMALRKPKEDAPAFIREGDEMNVFLTDEKYSLSAHLDRKTWVVLTHEVERTSRFLKGMHVVVVEK